MRRMPILYRIAPLTSRGCPQEVLCGIRPDFSGLSPCKGQVAYVLLTRAPVASGWGQVLTPAAPRLACVKPVASVHPEPGSNSSLLLILFFFFSNQTRQVILNYCLLQDTFWRVPCHIMDMPDLLRLLLFAVFRIDLRLSLSSQPRRGDERIALVLLLVYCNRFNVLFGVSGASFPKASAKLHPLSELTKLFRQKIQRNFTKIKQTANTQHNKNML